MASRDLSLRARISMQIADWALKLLDNDPGEGGNSKQWHEVRGKRNRFHLANAIGVDFLPDASGLIMQLERTLAFSPEEEAKLQGALQKDLGLRVEFITIRENREFKGTTDKSERGVLYNDCKIRIIFRESERKSFYERSGKIEPSLDYLGMMVKAEARSKELDVFDSFNKTLEETGPSSTAFADRHKKPDPDRNR